MNKSHWLKSPLLLGTLAIGSLAASPLVHGAERPVAASSVPLDRSCDRACLYRMLDSFLDALRQRDPWRTQWSKNAFATENNVAMPLGEGLWGTLTKLESYDLRLADPTNGQVAMFGAVNERGAVSPFVVRLVVRDGAISRAEMLVRRKASEPRMMADPKFEKKPMFDEVIPAGERLPRARLISIADGYFDTLQLNDGTLFTQFDDRCNRIENGVQTTNNEELKQLSPSLAMGCAEQFRLGYFRYDDRLRDRHYDLVDEERGLVLARAMMDHSGRLQTFKLTNGSVETSRYLSPHSYYMFELFKITTQGKIRQIEAGFLTIPYNTPMLAEPAP
jgi:hypothetical protein